MDEAELEARLRRIEQRLDTLEALEGMHDNPRPPKPFRPGAPLLDPPEPFPPTPAKVQGITWQQLSGSFARRYQAARNLAWTSGPHVQSLMDIAEAINIQPGDRIQHAKTLLDNFFADDFAKKANFSPGLLSKQFGRYLSPPEEEQKQDRTLQRVKAQEAERRYQEAKRQIEADHARKVRERGAQAPQRAKAHLVAVKDILEGE